MVSLTERVRLLLRASDGALPVCIENLILDIASEVDAEKELLRAHLDVCPSIEPPAARPNFAEIASEMRPAFEREGIEVRK